jgi:hypothetical protein
MILSAAFSVRGWLHTVRNAGYPFPYLPGAPLHPTGDLIQIH